LTENDLVRAPLSPVEALVLFHELDAFDCGIHTSLNVWLKRFAWINQQNESSRTYVVHRASRVVACYSLATGSVTWEEAPARVSKGLAHHPIPVILVTRLAVDKSEQGMGLGKAMLKDALARIANAAAIVGARAALVHAMDTGAAAFYRQYGFEQLPANELHLMLLMKDLRASLRT
jgi:GNAT superfamily N-acetyltransferase